MKRTQLIICLFISLACLLIYFSNGTSITSNDDVPTSLLAFNWLENHQANFDIFRDHPLIYTQQSALLGRQDPYYFIESSTGHLSAKYPIGPSIVSFPIYVLFFLGTKAYDAVNTVLTGIPSDSLDILSEEFLRSQRTNYETIAATLLTTLSVVLFYLASKLKFGQTTALLSTFIFGCSTSVWVVCSQGLRQHTVSNLVMLATMLALFKANRSIGNTQRLFLVLAGSFAGLLHASRPTSLLFFAALIAYCLYAYRKNSLFFLLGSSSILIGIAWNVYYFGLSNFLKGGYAQLTGMSQTYSLEYFPESAIGLLLSPSRGWLILCPVLLFIIPGIRRAFRWASGNDEKLLACLSLACLALYVQYWFYFAWSGVLVYGPSRFLIDVLPVLCFLINYFIYDHFQAVNSGKKNLFTRTFLIFISCIIFSTFVQAIGAFGDSTWAAIPTGNSERLWDIRDSVIERTMRGLVFDIRDPIDGRDKYVRGLNGEILELTDVTGKRITPISGITTRGRTILEMKLTNTGTSTWYGYETGMRQGLTRVSVDFERRNDDSLISHRRNKVYIKGLTVEPGETAIAIGEIRVPRRRGQYDMHLSMEAAGLGPFPNETEQPSYKVRILSRQEMIEQSEASDVN